MLVDHRKLRTLLKLLFRTFARIELEGFENLPETGGALISVNHMSIVEGPLIYAMIPREDCTALAAKKYQSNPFSRWLLNTARVIWLDRDNPDPRTLRVAIDRINQGWVMGIAPEGTRSRTGSMTAAKPGAAYLAAKTDGMLFALGVAGTETAFKDLLRFRRPSLRLILGKPFVLPPIDRGDRSGSLQRNADEIMCQIAALLPEKYHGVYAGYPRIAEIKNGQLAETARPS